MEDKTSGNKEKKKVHETLDNRINYYNVVLYIHNMDNINVTITIQVYQKVVFLYSSLSFCWLFEI